MREVDRSWMSPDVSMDERDLEQLREQALGVLSPYWRRAYKLVCEDGLSHREAAVILGVSRTRVSALVAKTRERLCVQLNDRGVEVPGWCRLEEFPME
jgi:DNA-directed RNA polymerase specialized sigma24 family protein